MDVTDRLNDMVERVQKLLPLLQGQTEAATKSGLIEPFISGVLGYDVRNIVEVEPEYTAGFGANASGRADYAIKRDGEPLIVIECKAVGVDLQGARSQLAFYFAATPARFGICTDGVRYHFYSDIDKPNILDETPFLVLDFQDPGALAADAVAIFVKDDFNLVEARKRAAELKHTRALKRVLHEEMHEPSQELVQLLMDKMGITGVDVEQFKGFIKTAARQLIENEVHVPHIIEPVAPTPTGMIKLVDYGQGPNHYVHGYHPDGGRTLCGWEGHNQGVQVLFNVRDGKAGDVQCNKCKQTKIYHLALVGES